MNMLGYEVDLIGPVRNPSSLRLVVKITMFQIPGSDNDVLMCFNVLQIPTKGTQCDDVSVFAKLPKYTLNNFLPFAVCGGVAKESQQTLIIFGTEGDGIRAILNETKTLVFHSICQDEASGYVAPTKRTEKSYDKAVLLYLTNGEHDLVPGMLESGIEQKGGKRAFDTVEDEIDDGSWDSLRIRFNFKRLSSVTAIRICDMVKRNRSKITKAHPTHLVLVVALCVIIPVAVMLLVSCAFRPDKILRSNCDHSYPNDTYYIFGRLICPYDQKRAGYAHIILCRGQSRVAVQRGTPGGSFKLEIKGLKALTSEFNILVFHSCYFGLQDYEEVATKITLRNPVVSTAGCIDLGVVDLEVTDPHRSLSTRMCPYNSDHMI